jgi:hypothetical protein
MSNNINIINNTIKDKLECIICMDDDQTNLIYNINCTCKYYYHHECLIKYGKDICLLCKKTIKKDNQITYILNPIITDTVTVVSISTQTSPQENNIHQETSLINCCVSLSCICIIIFICIYMSLQY